MHVEVYLTPIHAERYQVFDNVLDALNKADRKRASAFYHIVDKYRFLAGRWLLNSWLQDNKATIFIDNITADAYKRPVLQGLSFSISHTGNWVGIAVSPANENIGLDIEEVKPVEVKDLLLPFTIQEQQYILEQDSLNRFYGLWTRKEAVLKAIGQGFLLEPTLVEVLQEEITFREARLYLRKLDIAAGYTAHIATGLQNSEVSITLKS